MRSVARTVVPSTKLSATAETVASRSYSFSVGVPGFHGVAGSGGARYRAGERNDALLEPAKQPRKRSLHARVVVAHHTTRACGTFATVNSGASCPSTVVSIGVRSATLVDEDD